MLRNDLVLSFHQLLFFSCSAILKIFTGLLRSHWRIFDTALDKLLAFLHEILKLFGLFRCDVLIFEVVAVLDTQPFTLVDHCEEASHRQGKLGQIIVSIEDLAELFAHEVVGLELVFLFQKYIPQSV